MSDLAALSELARDLFDGLGPVQARRMFGCAGLFCGGVMFGLIDDGWIFLRTDEALKADLKAAGARGWVYTGGRRPKVERETSYWSLPESASDDPDEACAWARRALAVAGARKAAARPKRPARASLSPKKGV